MSVPCVCAGLADTDRKFFVQTDWREAIWKRKEGFDDALTQAKGQKAEGFDAQKSSQEGCYKATTMVMMIVLIIVDMMMGYGL